MSIKTDGDSTTPVTGGGGGGASILTGTYAALPAPGTDGNLYIPTDSYYLFRDNGSAWIPFLNGHQITLPVNGDFSWVNQGTGTIDATKGGLYLEDQSGQVTESFRMRIKTAPTPPYTIDVAFMPSIGADNFNYMCVNWRDSTTGRFYGYFVNQLGLVILYKYNNTFSWNSEYALMQPRIMAGPTYVRLEDDNTDLVLHFSGDGVQYREIFRVIRTDFLADPDQVGFALSNQNNQGNGLGMTILAWDEA